MRWLRFVVIAFIVALLHAGNVLNLIALGPGNIKPDLLLILLVFAAINCTEKDAIAASFLIGFLADMAAAPLGPYTIVFGVFGSILVQLRKIILMKKMFHQAIAIFVMGILTGSFVQILLYFKANQNIFKAYQLFVGTSLYSAVIGPYIYWIFSAMAEWLGIRRHRFGVRSGR